MPKARSALIVRKLLIWFSESARALPWRRTRDPYAIWVSEIMLQQTQVKTVLPYWERWMQALPNIQALAKARPQKIHKLWEGLGYYARVRNMQRAAKIIMDEHSGAFPRAVDAVLTLPGIGRYTAGAICSIAFNQPTPILDGNVIRVLARLFGIKGDSREKKTNAKFWRIAEELVKSAQSTYHQNQSLVMPAAANQYTCAHLNQSLMELGALICTPKNPRCSGCPLKSSCVAHRKRIVHLLPKLSRRAPCTSRRFCAFVIKRNSRYLVRQRPDGIVNAHLWEFPNCEVNGETNPGQIAQSTLGFAAESLQQLSTLKHTITRYRITLDVFSGLANGSGTPSSICGQWLRIPELRKLPFSSAHKKILGSL